MNEGKKNNHPFELYPYTHNIQMCSVKKKDSLHSPEQNENVRRKRTRTDEQKVFIIRECL